MSSAVLRHIESRVGLPGELKSSGPAIVVDGLSFTVQPRRGVAAEVPVLADLDLTVNECEFVSIVGQSGCGKSTLLNFIAGLIPIQSGQIRVSLSSDDSPELGYMFQQHGLLPWRNVQRNVELGLEVAGVPQERRAQMAREILAQMGLAGFESHYPGEISGGMRQRVALARSLVTSPRVLLMDEPFGALDAQTRICIQELFGDYWEHHQATVVFVTHDIHEALYLSDRVIVMGARPGRVVAEYTVDIERPRSQESVRHSYRYQSLFDSIWNDIKDQSHMQVKGGNRE